MWRTYANLYDAGQVAGDLCISGVCHAFRTAPNSPINPATDDLSPGWFSEGLGINNSGQVVGYYCNTVTCGAFRTAPNSPINPASDDLGTLGGSRAPLPATGHAATSKLGENCFR
ncbi:MAG TPA: hypothetical protein VEI01_22355 [Terriglobales bacterium]|nr:hypothetical protein [Terriglobales bacterium]